MVYRNFSTKNNYKLKFKYFSSYSLYLYEFKTNKNTN